ncbi:hypothetical protein [Celeribacter sp.]|uniref:hypothetical protein n=1 Tax=Celeribacter sp. TaxID=1890673 RepID=UPI003A94A13C
MTKEPTTLKDVADRVVKNIRRKTGQMYSSEEKIRIVLVGWAYRVFLMGIT